MAVKASDQVTVNVIPTPTAVRAYYLKQASSLNTPAKPSVHPPPSPWSTTEPAYSTGSTDTLYTIMVSVWGDQTFQYGDVQKSSSFEAAKQAFNKAVAAGNAADNAINIANVTADQLRYSFNEEPPEDPVMGAVWFPQDEQGRVTGMWQWNGDAWGTHTTLTGMLIVPTEDGGQTIIDQDGIEATQIVADILRADVLYADVAGVKTLVITDIPRQNLASDVDTALSTAEELGSRIVASEGKLTISRNRPKPSDPLTAMQLGATTLDMVVANKSVVHIDSELEQISVPNVLITETLQVGAHAVRTLPGTGVTTFQQVIGV